MILISELYAQASDKQLLPFLSLDSIPFLEIYNKYLIAGIFELYLHVDNNKFSPY